MNVEEKARTLQRCLGWPSDEALKNYLNNNMVMNSKVTSANVDRANFIFGKVEPLLQGKKNAPQAIKHDMQQLRLPTGIDWRIKLYINIFYVNGNTFFHAKAKPVDFVMIQKLHDKKETSSRKSSKESKKCTLQEGSL